MDMFQIGALVLLGRLAEAIKHVLFAVAQSWSQHIVHEASFCEGLYSVNYFTLSVKPLW